MGNCFQKETNDEVEDINSLIEKLEKENRQEREKLNSEIKELDERHHRVNEIIYRNRVPTDPWIEEQLNQLDREIKRGNGYGSIPRRRIRLTKSASKHKSKKTRSEYAKKKKISRKTRKY
jgi:hypothetical protein